MSWAHTCAVCFTTLAESAPPTTRDGRAVGPLCGPTYPPGAPRNRPNAAWAVYREGQRGSALISMLTPKSLSMHCDMGEWMEGRADRWMGRQSRATGNKPLLPRASAASGRRPPSDRPTTFSGAHGTEAHADQRERERERSVSDPTRKHRCQLCPVFRLEKGVEKRALARVAGGLLTGQLQRQP